MSKDQVRLFTRLSLLVSVFMNVSCVSAWVSMTGKKHPWGRNDVTHEFFTQNYGRPILKRSVNSADAIAHRLRIQNKDNQASLKASMERNEGRPDRQKSSLARTYPIVRSYEIFHYRGLMQNPEAGAGAATANALTLGAGEAISLPLTLLERSAGAMRHHYFMVSLDDKGKMNGWKEITSKDFIPPKQAGLP